MGVPSSLHTAPRTSHLHCHLGKGHNHIWHLKVKQAALVAQCTMVPPLGLTCRIPEEGGVLHGQGTIVHGLKAVNGDISAATNDLCITA
jgi:hypothetical protein